MTRKTSSSFLTVSLIFASVSCTGGAKSPPLAKKVVSIAAIPKTSTTTAFATPTDISPPKELAQPLAYNLEEDRESRLLLAHKELGETSRAVRVNPVFVLAGSTPAATQGAAPFIDAVLAAYQNGRFTKAPSKAISIYIFPQASAYHAFCRKQYDGKDCISVFGFYEPSERKIIMNGGADGTLSHELVHPFVEADFPDAPTWVNEGIASLYEAPVLYRKGEIRGAKNWRLPKLKEAIHSQSTRSSVRLESLFAMSDETFRGDNEGLHYAMARYACQWMEEKGVLWNFYHAYRDGFRHDTRGIRAFTAAVGKTPEDASQEWIKWVMKL